MSIVITPLGDLAYRYSVLTNVYWWSEIFKEANDIADDDGDVALFFDEKIKGLTEMRDRFYELQPQQTVFNVVDDSVMQHGDDSESGGSVSL